MTARGATWPLYSPKGGENRNPLPGTRCDGNKLCSRCTTRAETTPCVYEVHIQHAKEELIKQIRELRAKNKLNERIIKALQSGDKAPDILRALSSGDSLESKGSPTSIFGGSEHEPRTQIVKIIFALLRLPSVHHRDDFSLHLLSIRLPSTQTRSTDCPGHGRTVRMTSFISAGREACPTARLAICTRRGRAWDYGWDGTPLSIPSSDAAMHRDPMA
ncbi:hypothetical protein V501_00151 [Pseudogymnoascus sp. VKM F-4519 (FW-2642)]|nr:hypothetical protein V501_00151 [Pseudogymnoascus sp. VKM F-4519 (FW-2642)]